MSKQAIKARDQGNVIGSSTAPLNIQVTGVVNVTAGPTDSFLEATGNIAVDQIVATGSITLISTGAITNGAPPGTPPGTPNIQATGLTITAVNGIGTAAGMGTAADPLLTDVGTLNATNTGSGDIDINNDDRHVLSTRNHRHLELGRRQASISPIPATARPTTGSP